MGLESPQCIKMMLRAGSNNAYSIIHRTPSSLSPTDVLLSDCPDYRTLAPSPSLRRKKIRLKPKKRGAEPGEEEEDLENIRMCFLCEKLAQRSVAITKQLTSIILQSY